MLKVILVIAAAASAIPLLASSAEAGGKGAWCLTTRDGAQNCGYSSKAQCMASVSGVGGSCDRNQLRRRR